MNNQLWPDINRLRGQLIDKDIDGTITDEEKKLLASMQEYADFYIESTTPRTYPDLT